MADLVDVANDSQQIFDDLQIAKIRSKATRPGSGYCLNCGEILAPDHSFCDQDCQQDHQKRNRMKGYA